MKQSFWVLCLLFSIQAFAQPVLDNSYFPTIGKAFSGRSFSKTAPLPPIQEGANITWNFAGLDSVYITDYSFAFRNKNVLNTDSGSRYPSATSAYVSFFGTDSIENFHQVSGNDLLYLGNNLKGADFAERFTTPRIDLRKNLAFEETFTHQSLSKFSTSGFSKYSKYRDTITYAGYGTLITPFATYENVILIKKSFSIDFAFNQNGPYTFGYLGRNWLWYIPGYGLPYMRYGEEINLEVEGEILYSGFVGFIPVVGNVKTFSGRELKLIPSVLKSDPGQTIQVSGMENRSATVLLTDAMGRMVRKTQLKDGVFQISNLSAGIYSVHVQSEEGAAVLKLMVQ